MVTSIRLTPVFIAKALAAIVAILFVANGVCIYVKSVLGFSFHTIHIFYFHSEGNFPSLYSSLSLLLAGVLLFVIGNAPAEKQGRRSFFWRLLGFIFVFLAVDEAVGIHEALSDNTRAMIGVSSDAGYFHFAWILPYLAGVSLLALFLLRFFFRLPKNTRWHFFMAGTLFLSGAVGFEMLEGKHVAQEGLAGKDDLYYMVLVTCEETLEMIGVIVFIYALTTYYVRHINEWVVNITFSEDAKTEKSTQNDSILAK